jgi:CBS domain containing-hemolysin-like protein
MIAASFGTLDAFAIFAIVVLLLLALALVAVDEALSRTNVVRVTSIAGAPPARVGRLVRILNERETYINSLRLVVLILQLTETTLVALLAAKFLEWPGVVALVALNICIVFVVTEAVPRTLGIIRSDRIAMGLAAPVELLVGFAPIRLLASALIWVTNIVVPGRGLRQGPFAFPEELIALADAAVEDAVLHEDERDLIESVIEFSDTIVREVMVPRTDMTTVALDASVAKSLEVTSAVGYSRVPAVGENVDDVVGLVYVKDLIRAELDGRADQHVGSMLRPSRFVPETKKVAELLKEMQREKFHMAIAVDEYGGIAGLVTLEDLIEELVGEIVDEYDVEEPLVERQIDGSLRVDARISIDELNDLAGMELPEGNWDTVAGLVFDRFGRVPSVGDTCDLNGYSLRVERLQGRRITRVRIVSSDSPSLDPVAEDA